MKKNLGFSLVELLIVITIIALLSTIVLNSLSTSRARAYDSKVTQQLASFRTAAEIYYLNNGGYEESDNVINICTAGIFVNLDPANGAPGRYIDPAILPTFTQLKCGSQKDAFAIKATLFSGNEYWCVDSKGASRAVSGEIGNSVTACPF